MYYGTAMIEVPASIGTLDLAFQLDVVGGAISRSGSWIDLGQTLLFPATETVDGAPIGPRVSGSIGPTAFALSSDTFESIVVGKAEPVQRQIALAATAVSQGGAALEGDYTETVTGLTPEALVIRGHFRLVKPLPLQATSGLDLNADGCLDLDEIRAGGSDPTAVELADLSAALNLYHAPVPGLRVGRPPGPGCTDAEQTIQAAMQAHQDGRQ